MRPLDGEGCAAAAGGDGSDWPAATACPTRATARPPRVRPSSLARRSSRARASNNRRGPGRGRVVRTLAAASAPAGREDRRRSLAYFGQLTDFQLADEESPARVEFATTAGSSLGVAPAGGAAAVHHRLVDPPDEPVHRREPGRQGDGAGAAMDFALDDRRPGGQHAAQRDALGARSCSRGRAARPQQRQQEPRRLHARRAPELRGYPPTRPTSPRRRSTRACRTTTTTTRAPNRTSTTRTSRGRASRGLARPIRD